MKTAGTGKLGGHLRRREHEESAGQRTDQRSEARATRAALVACDPMVVGELGLTGKAVIYFLVFYESGKVVRRLPVADVDRDSE